MSHCYTWTLKNFRRIVLGYFISGFLCNSQAPCRGTLAALCAHSAQTGYRLEQFKAADLNLRRRCVCCWQLLGGVFLEVTEVQRNTKSPQREILCLKGETQAHARFQLHIFTLLKQLCLIHSPKSSFFICSLMQPISFSSSPLNRLSFDWLSVIIKKGGGWGLEPRCLY